MIARVLTPCFTVFLLVCSAVGAEQAVPRRPEIVRVDVGLGGHYRAGVWTPVTVSLRGGDQALRGQVTLTVPDSDGVPTRITSPADQPVELAPGSSVSVPLVTRFGRLESEMVVEFRAGDGLLISRAFRSSSTPQEGQYPSATPSTHRLLGVLSATAAGVEQAAELLRQQPGEQTLVVSLGSSASLPTRWYAYESLDALVLSASKPELLAGIQPNGPQMIALDKWVRMGGKLLLAVGGQAEQVLAEGSPLARFSPGRLQRTIPLPASGALALEAYAGGSAPMERGPGGRLDLRVPQLQDVRGTVEARDGNLPLVIRRAWGLGQVIFLAADLEARPLADWVSRGLLVGRLLDLPVASGGGEIDERSAVMHYGFTDLSGQLRSALDQYPGVWPVPFSLVAGLIVVYILLIGPIDYFLLRKLSPWMELTWVTFPVLVIGFSAAAYLLAHRFKGEDVRVNQISLIDVDTESKWLRGTCWANIFSPRMERYDLACRPIPLGSKDTRGETVLAWMGLPGGALGGMDPTAAGAVSMKQPYEYSPELNALRGVPIPVWASKSFAARWNATTDTFPEARLANEDQVLTGRVINTLGFPLEDCLLVHGRWAYDLGTLQPGQVATVGATSHRRELKAMMTGRRMVIEQASDKYHQQTTPYDQSSVELAYILRMMSFFEQAGGRGYTGLVNRYQNFVDLTSLLKADRAVLIATVPDENSGSPRCGSLLLHDGQPIAGPNARHLTVCRFVYPIAKPD